MALATAIGIACLHQTVRRHTNGTFQKEFDSS